MTPDQINLLLKELAKPGWKTSELKVVLIVFALLLLLSQGIIPATVIPAQYQWIVYVYRFFVAAVAAVPVANKYIDSRTDVKDSIFGLLSDEKPIDNSTKIV